MNFNQWLKTQPELIQELPAKVQRSFFESNKKLIDALAGERSSVKTLRLALSEAGLDPKDWLPLQEAANMANWLEAMFHMRMTVLADEQFAGGFITREERKIISHAIGEALESFNQVIEGQADQLMVRSPWSFPEVQDLEEGEEILDLDYVALEEAAVGPGGETKIKLIGPGWGTSGFYSPNVLKQAASDRMFDKGLKMYWNHPTPTEESERPEGDLNALASALTTPARWEQNGKRGPGLYADAKVFKPFRDSVDELAKDIGVSIRAFGKSDFGNAEGRDGPIITELTAARSVDYVTEPGADGRIVEMFESARPKPAVKQADDPPDNKKKESKMTLEKDLTEAQKRIVQLEGELEESETEVQRRREADVIQTAANLVTEALKGIKIPGATKKRLINKLSADPPATEAGKLDAEKLSAKVIEAVKEEIAYLAEVTKSGSVVDLGESGDPLIDPVEEDDDDQVSDEKLEEGMEKSFANIGNMSDAAVKEAARGRGPKR